MKSVTEFHREALDQALRQALTTSQAALRQRALETAATHLIHPRFVLESPLLTDSHPWRREALAVADAFEAVTNGMEDPAVLEALNDVRPDSPFQPWRHFILALHFFYEGLDEGVTDHLHRIPATSPVAILGHALVAMVRSGPLPQATPARLRLMNAVVPLDPKIVTTVQDVSEGLESNDEDLFWRALTDWLEAVAPGAPERAQSAVLWAWNQLAWREFDEAILLDLVSNLWGKAESYRLAALGTLPWDPEGAALLWLRFLLTEVREGAEAARVTEIRHLLDDFHGAASQAGEGSAEWNATWGGLIRSWNLEAEARGWQALRWTAATPSPDSGSPQGRPAPDGQLDLFA